MVGPRPPVTDSGIEVKSFDRPDETVTFEHGRVDVVKVGSLGIGREVLEPGCRWSIHVKPIVGTEWCEFHHVSFLLSGRVRIGMRDGSEREVAAGEIFDVIPGHDAWVVGDEPAVSIDFQGVVGWARSREVGARLLTTILFTDIVGSTEVAERVGDRAWRQLLAVHAEDVRSLLGEHHGREVKTTGDGFLATFDTPARAVECALAIAAASERLGLSVRAGVHTGEVEMADGDLGGVAVHLAARIMEAAELGGVMVSGTSRELASGIAVEFVDRGSRIFKGLSGERRIFEARPRSPASSA